MPDDTNPGGDEDVLEEATSVLLLAPMVRDTATEAAATLLERGSRPVDHVVGVTITHSAESWVRAWDRHAGSSTRVSCIDVDGGTRAVAASDGGLARPSVEQVADPSDLEALGRAISDVLERATDNGERLGLAVHSVSDLLHHVDEATAFKFVYTLGEVVRRVDGTAYFHVDPDSHDVDTVDTFATTCDAVVELNGDVTVTAREEW